MDSPEQQRREESRSSLQKGSSNPSKNNDIKKAGPGPAFLRFYKVQ